MTIYSLINTVRAKGIILWQENGQLKIKAPKGALTDDIREQITAHKSDILAFLSQVSATKKDAPSILPVNRKKLDSQPLSFLQERLWIINKLNPENTGYNIPVAFTIKGKLDIVLLNRAFNVLIARHESLRTVFPDHEGQAQQKIQGSLYFQLETIDLSRAKARKPDYKEAKKICEAEAKTPFNLAAGPLIRGKVIKLAPQEHVLMLNIHHIVSDDWSVNVLFKELFLAIDALQQDKEVDLPALPVQYLDYSIWQRQWFEEGGELKRQLAYWQQKLTGVPESLDLATDYPRPGIQSFEGASHTFTIDTQLTAFLKNLAEQQGCTLYMTLLAIFKVLLYRYTGQEDLCIGSAISNRQPEETHGLIGMFVNTLALRTRVESEDTFLKVLGKVKTTCVEAYEHQDTPFEKIVDALQVRRNPAVNPLFQIMVTQNIPLGLSKENIKPLHLDRHSSKFDMTVEFTEDNEGFTGVIEYCTSLFSQGTIERLINNFTTLCGAVTANPDAKIIELDFLTKAERQQLLINFNNTQVSYDKSKCIHHLFAEQVKRNPGAIAAISGDEQLTYQQLYDKSNALALYLQSIGVKQDSLVGVCIDRSIDMLVALMGILQAGGAYIPLDAKYPDDRIAFMLEDSEASVVLTQENLKRKLGKFLTHKAELIALDKQWAEITDSVAELKTQKVKLSQKVAPNDLAYVIYTSGSTGKPKGVAIEHRSTVALIDWARGVFAKDQLAGVLASTSICFDLSVYEIFLPLSVGGKVILVPDALALTTFAHRESVTLINTVPSIMSELVRLEGAIPDSVSTINLAGEPLSSALVDKIYDNSKVEKVYDLYGPSEDTTYSTFTLRVKNGPQTIGCPISNTQAYILDRFNNPLPIGIPGELHLAGDGLARGYLKRPELTKEKFISNPFNPGTSMYKTGDLARWLENGAIEYLGRIDKQVKIRGFRIEIGEVEHHLNSHLNIKESAVVAQGEGVNKRLVAFYVATETKGDNLVSFPNEELNTHLKQFLSDYMLPSAFVSLESIPLTQNGKIDRRVLEGMEVGSEANHDYLEPGDDIESKLVDIWAEVLNVNPETIGVNSNFFDVGGNSLTAVTLAATIEQKTQCKFSPVDLFKYSTVRSISLYIKESTVNTQENSAPKTKDSIPLKSHESKKAQPDSDYPEYYEDSLAIIGISCHFPDAENHWKFWENLVDCRESVNMLSREEAERLKVPPEILNNPDYVPLKPWMEGKEFFDPEFFQISSGNAALMDPQFRQLLQHSWKAVEDAGYRCEEIENTSVFMSASNNFYQSLAEKISAEGHVMKDSSEFVSWILAQGGTIPTMISYQLGLRGPSAFVHSNCSSSMTGLYYALQSLQSKDVDYALVGAATLSASLSLGYLQMPGMNFSSDGHCKAFDAKADGMVDGEGVGVILVKRAVDAIKDGDHIYSLIRGIGINNDGSDKAGFYAPGVSGQTSVICNTLEKTKINPESIGYVEAHGTGTALGDPIEVKSISEAYEKYTNKKQFCAIGSVKPNIGHLDTAAGLAGCIKLAISLYHKKFPRIINYTSPNPQIDFESSPFYVSDREESWSEDQYPQRAAISSFGIGGTNAHAILEEYTRSKESVNGTDFELYVIPLSAQKEDVLKEYAQKLLEFLDGRYEIKLSEMAFTLQTGRKEMKYRAVFLVKTLGELADELRAFIENKKSDGYFQGDASAAKKPVESLEEDEDYQELIKHWFTKKKVRRLAQLWATGTKLDWRLLYDESYPLRMSLPAYPFAKVRCWIDTTPSISQVSSGGHPGASTVLHPLLHTNTSDFSRQSYGSVFTGQEFFLADHQINGQKVLPAVAYLEMACAAVMRATPEQFEASMLELSNIVWVKPITVTEEKQTGINLSVNNNGQIEYEIVSKDVAEETIHCEGKAEFIDEPLPDKIDIVQLKSQMNDGSIDSVQAYAAFNETGTYYGPAHQGLKNIWVGERQVLAQLRLPAVVEDTFHEYKLHPSLMDGALQASNILFDYLNQDAVHDVLPFALKSLRIGSGCPEEMFVWVRLAEGSKLDDKLIKLDIDLFDAEGNVCVQMHGFSFRRLSKDHGGLNTSSDMRLAAPVWQSRPLETLPSPSGIATNGTALEQHYVILCEVPGIQIKQLQTLLPGRQCLQIEKKQKDIAERFAEVALECFERIQAIFKGKPKRKVLIQFIVANDHEQSVFSGLSGLFKTASLENPNFIGQIIQIDEQTNAEQLAQLSLDNSATPEESLIRYVQGQRHILQWKSVEAAEDTSKIAFSDKGVYLITGGLGGLGVLFTKEILQQVQNGRIILTGRSELTNEKKEILDALSAQGTTVEYHQVDIGNVGQVDELISSITNKYKQLNGIIHSAGIISDSFILKKTPEEFSKVLAPKVRGTLNLDQACRNIDLDFIVLFSSDSALGSIGQADYAAANGFMDQFASYRNQLVSVGQRQGLTVSINWPLWQDGGMRPDQAILEIHQKSTGMRPMPTSTGMQAFYQCLELKYNQLSVSIKDLSQSENQLSDNDSSHQVADQKEELVPEETFATAGSSRFDEGDLLEQTQEFLKKQFSDLFKLPSHQIDPKAPLENYGIDSILTINITNQLEKTFGALSKTLLFEYHTIQELAEYFVEEFDEKLTNLFVVSVDNRQKKPVEQKPQPEPKVEAEIKSAQPRATRFYPRSLADVGVNSNNGFRKKDSGKEDLIAIVGLSGRYPEASNIEEYWNNLRDGKDCIVEIPKDRWDWREYFSEDKTKDGVHYSKYGGFIAGVDEFDPRFFNISPKEAEILDPQERLFLQHAWMAIEDAGYTRATLQIPHGNNLPGQVGVYVGVMYSEYQLFGAEISQQGKRMGFANSMADVANRVSFVLNVHGPSFTVDTMCSSSLTTIHLACQDLKNGRTDMAIAGGVNISVHPNKYFLLSSGQYISTTGHCHSFGAGGDGYIPGEGVGAVVLKRLSDAEESGDHIYGVIRGSALNHGGKPSGYTVPNPQAQSALISQVLEESNTDPRHISYIEAHGTGTPLGDPIEINALTKAFYQKDQVSSAQRTDGESCMIGSVKSNIGHCESAAGIAGLTKILLQMKHQQIVPSLHSRELNPNIDFAKTPFVVNQKLKSWEQPVVDGKKLPRIAGISSFGAGGSNAHIILEEYSRELEPIEENKKVVVPLSARTPVQLKQKVLDLIHFIGNEQKPIDLVSLAYTLQVGREAMEERLGFIVDSIDQLRELLESFTKAQESNENTHIENVYQGQVKRNKETMFIFSHDDDMRETIDKWIARDKLEKLLDLWVKGLDLDWQKLYGNAKPKRMSLPAYPFAKERYWWNDAVEDGKLTLKQWVDKQAAAKVIHPMLHVNTSNLGQQSYSTTFTGEETYLKDYHTMGQKALPAVAYLEMARAALEHASPDKKESDIVVLHNVALAQPVIVGKSKQVRLSLFAQDKKRIDFEVYSDDTNEDVVHCQGHAIISEQLPLAKLDIAEIKAQSDRNQLLSAIQLSELDGNNLNGYILHPNLLNSALETASKLVPGSNGSTSFPYTVDSVHIISAYKEKMLAWVRYADNIQPAGDDIKIDIDLTDEQGNISVQMRGISYLQASTASDILVPEQVTLSSGFTPREIPVIPSSNQASEKILPDGHQQISIQSTLKKPNAIVLSAPSAVSPKSDGPTGKIRIKLADAADSISVNGGYAMQRNFVSLSDYGNGVFSIHINDAHLSKDVTRQILEALNTVKQIDSVKLLLIRGGESDFLQGGRQQINDAVEQKLYQAISTFPYPVIAVVQGNVGGAGFLLAALCDFMICSEEATYLYTDPHAGLYPTAVEHRLLKERFGTARTYDFMYVSTKATGKELKEKGWNFPILPKDQIEQHLQRLALNLIQKPQKSLRLIKQHLARHIIDIVNELAIVDPVLPADNAKTTSGNDNIPAFKNINVKVHEQHVLLIHISPAEAGYSINDCLADLVNIFEWIKQASRYKSIVIRSDNSELIGTSEAHFSPKSVSDFSNLILKSEIPVVAVSASDSKGFGWLLSQFCDACVYSKTASYSTTDIMRNSELARLAAMIFAYRFGYGTSREILLSGTDYSGFALQQRIKTLQVAEEDEALAAALKIADFWAGLPASVLISWKGNTATSIHEKMNSLPVLGESEEEFNPVADASPVSLKSKVISASTDPDGILVVKMEDREAKNMFSDALTHGIIEVFEHIEQTPAYKAVILTGFDNYFASGGTKEDLVAIQQGKAKFTDIKFYHLAMMCRIPVIAAMQGHAIGAGWAFGMFADFTIFSEESKYLSPYMNLGFTPGAGATFILPEKIGTDLARETLLVAQEISGSELKGRGLQLPVVPRQQVLTSAMALARQIAKNSLEQIVAIKTQLTQHLHAAVEETYQLELAMHDETFVGQSETLAQIQKYFGQDNNETLQKGQLVSTAAANVEQAQSAPVTTDSAVNKGSLSGLAANLKKYLAQELHMQEHEIDEDAEFIDLGLDSITGVTWVRKINEKYDLSVEATKIYSYPTLSRFAVYIKDEVSKHGTLTDEPEADKPVDNVSLTVSLNENGGRPVPSASSNEADSFLSIRAELNKLLAEELHMQEHEIDEEAEFIDLGLDSITGVTWVRKINEKYKLTIEATKVYSYPTLSDFSRFVKAEAEKHGTVVEEQVNKTQEPIRVDVPVYTPERPLNKITSTPSVVRKLTSWRKQSSLRISSAPSTRSQVEPIAIVGMAGQFPQAKDVEEFWNNITEGKNCISKVPKARWDLDTYYSEGEPIPGKTNSEWMGYLEEYDLFDPLFFNISPTEAESMDPQQRLFLQTCWHSIESAGYDAKALSGSNCGVFVGSGIGDYQFLSRELQISAKGFTGTANSILAARISYFLNLQGPCLTIDTACSSSLVAIATACDSLISGNSNMALAGGVCVMATPDLHIKSAQSGMLSQDGRCYTFDNRANGFVPGEGVGVVMLKRLSDAQKDQDRIFGVIEGWGVNQDGKTNGITAPSPESQRRLMQDVYDKFQIDPANIQLIEAHGTGTKLGDPIEVAALVESFGKYTNKKDYCAIGSVKSNIGHCMAAAGVAGVIKSSMALKNKQLPPTVNFTQLNEHISLKDTPFYVNDRLQDWNGSGKHLAAVSSFGFSGTNAHLVISEYVPKAEPKKPVVQNPEVIIPLSARNTDRLNQKASDLLDYIRKYPSVDLNEMAYTLQVGREAMDDRLGFVVSSVKQLADKLQAYVDGEKGIDGVFQGQVNSSKEGMQFINQDNEIRETLIDKWFSSSHLSKLVGAWVKGLSFDWNRLYGTVKPQRIDLPLYPFAKERYWVEHKDLGIHTSNSESSGVIHPLLHTNTSNFSQQCYSSIFTGKEFFLKDHQVQIDDDGSAPQKLLPGVAYLEMARAAIQDAMSFAPESDRLELQNIIWVRPVVVTEKKQISIALLAIDNEHIDFEIYSLNEGQKVIHCQGQGVLKSHNVPAQVDVERLKNETHRGHMDADSTYTALVKMGLHYGPAHQGIKVIHQGEKQVLAQLQLPEVVGNNHAESGFILHPALMDSALQAAVGFTEDLNQFSGKPSLPFALESLRVFSPCEKIMYSWVRYSPGNKSDGKLSKLDIDLINLDGTVSVQMRGLTSRILDNETKQHQKMTDNMISDKANGNGNGSSFNETLYETLIENIVNNEVSIDEAVNLG